jgi:integrase
MRTLSASLGWAVEQRRLPANPCAQLSRLKVQPTRHHAFVPAEVERLARCAQALTHYQPAQAGAKPRPKSELERLRDRVMICFQAYVGLRPSELFALRVSDLHAFARPTDPAYPGYVSVTRKKTRDNASPGPIKNYQERNALVIAPAFEDVQEWLARLDQGDGLLFPRDPEFARDAFLAEGSFGKHTWRPACLAAGLASHGQYDLRHTCASLMAHQGSSYHDVARQLGDRVSTVERHYIHFFDHAKMEQAKPMLEAIREARS